MLTSSLFFLNIISFNKNLVIPFFIKYFEGKNKIKIDVISDNTLIIPEYVINFKNKSKKILEIKQSIQNLSIAKKINYEKKKILAKKS